MPNVAELLPAELARQVQTGRQWVESRRRAPEEEVLATGTPLDALLAGGGLRRGTMVELIGWGSSGRFSLVVGALAAATARGEAAALVDLGDGLDPRHAADAGVDLPRLLWARPRHLKDALACVETILDAGLPLVVLDLGVPPIPGGRGVEAFWLRLARSAQSHRVALLVSSPYRVSGTSAHAVVEARDRRGRWVGAGLEPKLLDGVDARLDLVKGPGWRRADLEDLRLRAPSPVAVPATETSSEAGTEHNDAPESPPRQDSDTLAKIHPWRPRQSGRRTGRGRTAAAAIELLSAQKQSRAPRDAAPPPDPLLRPRPTTAGPVSA